MAIWQERDIQRLIDEFGIPVTVGAVTTKAIVSRTDEELEAAGLPDWIGKGIVAEAKHDAFPGLAVNGILTIGSVQYRAHSVIRIGDGGTVQVLCAFE